MGVSIYLDASVTVALFTEQEPLTGRANKFLKARRPQLVISDFAMAEFASAIARLVRMAALTAEQAAMVFADFDVWTARATHRVETTAADVAMAAASLRRLTLTLRTPDALNIAIAQRVGSTLATFDVRMAENANALGLEIAAI